MGRVYKGIKENGAIFSHPNPWAVIAAAKLGRGDRAMRFFDTLLPYNQNDKIEIRQAEPYVYCQFVYGSGAQRALAGRAIRGSPAGGLELYRGHAMDSRHPTGFDGLDRRSLHPRRMEGLLGSPPLARRHLHIKRAKSDAASAKGVASIRLNGKTVQGPIPAQAVGSRNEVLVIMG